MVKVYTVSSEINIHVFKTKQINNHYLLYFWYIKHKYLTLWREGGRIHNGTHRYHVINVIILNPHIRGYIFFSTWEREACHLHQCMIAWKDVLVSLPTGPLMSYRTRTGTIYFTVIAVYTFSIAFTNFSA